jgi:hypothetical protein
MVMVLHYDKAATTMKLWMHTATAEIIGLGGGGPVKAIAGVVLALFLFLPLAAQAEDETAVASIKTVQGDARVIRGTESAALKAGDRVYRNDRLKTGPGGSLALVFKDDTLVSIGPVSEVVVKEFLFSPAKGKLSFVAKLLKGSAAYVSGIIGKLSPESVRFETPVATIGVRGTTFAVRIEGSGEESL